MTTVPPSQATPIVLDTQILGTIDYPTRVDIPAHGMRLIRLDEAKVTKLVEEVHVYVNEAIETTLAPHKTNLKASVLDPPKIVLAEPILPVAAELFSTQPRVSIEPLVDHSPERDNVEDDDDADDRSERKSKRMSNIMWMMIP
ncbi:hypothetical protein K7X08_021658 [Anisodus acutangulus]|uniref:Uncharacterized protein n=1 Tax=Anisodus acutangulus TaxID=402998 RepID=A0A9Q1M5D4_9SOLA|nr:hypothetical protein K7X08_021658 [Anisodus acutangulus]